MLTAAKVAIAPPSNNTFSKSIFGKRAFQEPEVRTSSIAGLKSLCLLSVFAFLPLSTHAQDRNADIYGQWKISAVAGSADSFGLTDRQIHALIGKPIIIDPEHFAFNGRTCKQPPYSRRTEETTTYFRREWQANASELKLPNPVTIISTGCNELFPIRKDHILIAEESGVFFEAVRVKSASPKAQKPAHTNFTRAVPPQPVPVR